MKGYIAENENEEDSEYIDSYSETTSSEENPNEVKEGMLKDGK